MAGNENGSDGRPMIPVEAWQKMECDRIGIASKEHNQILELADEMKRMGMGYQYNALIKAIVGPSLDLSGAKTLREHTKR